MDIKALFSSWKFDSKTALFTLLISPVILFLLATLRRYIKVWSSYAMEGAMYWLSRGFKHSLAGALTLKRYCRLRLAEDNRYLFVPSSLEVKLDIDKVFVTLTMERQTSGKIFSHRDVLDAGNRLRIVGDPGSGKSSLVKRLFRDTCQQVLDAPRSARLPILVELRNLVVPSTVAETKLGEWFLEKLRSDCAKTSVYQMAECFKTYAENSGLLVLLDGLDEVSSSGYPRVHKAIVGLSERLGQLSEKTVIVLTMRTQFHQQVKDTYRNVFGHALFLKPFAPADIYEFLVRWPFSSNIDEHVARIYGELTDRPTLREMCSNPLVLAMYVAEDQAAGHVVAPDSRTEFYRKVTDELILKRRLQQTGPVPAHAKLREQRESILGRLAYQHLLDSAQPTNSLAWGDALRVVQDVLKCTKAVAETKFRELAKETGLISEERPEQSFRFIHLTFCEFLAAFEAVHGQADGWSSLVRSHTDFQKNKARPEIRSRLIEVIPFAAGLLPRVNRSAATEDVAKLGDQGLLGRCFLETKLYDHKCWSEFIEAQKLTFLKTPELEWDESWLRDLHLFNVVVRDASQCSAHIPAVGQELDLDDFFGRLVGKQRESLTKLLSAYAAQDAAAAFRLAEVSNLDLIEDFPQIVMQHCDQPPFLALLLERVSREPTRVGLLACLLSEAALRSNAVAKQLFTAEASATLKNYTAEIEPRRRWYKQDLLPERLHTQLLTIALSKPFVLEVNFPLLNVLRKVSPPGRCRIFNGYYFLTVFFGGSLMIAIGLSIWPKPFGTNLGWGVGGFFVLIYLIIFPLITLTLKSRRSYRALIGMRNDNFENWILKFPDGFGFREIVRLMMGGLNREVQKSLEEMQAIRDRQI